MMCHITKACLKSRSLQISLILMIQKLYQNQKKQIPPSCIDRTTGRLFFEFFLPSPKKQARRWRKSMKIDRKHIWEYLEHTKGGTYKSNVSARASCMSAAMPLLLFFALHNPSVLLPAFCSKRGIHASALQGVIGGRCHVYCAQSYSRRLLA